MTDYQPINCSEYDWLEIACLDRYDVELDLGVEMLRGIALDLNVKDGEEFLRTRVPDGSFVDVRVDRIRSITVHSRPARFESRTFSGKTT